jgi:serine/threonine protein kinase
MWTEEQVHSHYGQLRCDPVRPIAQGHDIGPHAPSYLVGPAALDLPLAHTTGELLLIDFGEAIRTSSKADDAAVPPRKAGMPLPYAAPELLVPAAVAASRAAAARASSAHCAAPAAAVATSDRATSSVVTDDAASDALAAAAQADVVAVPAIASKAADVWALACTIFELRAATPLFDSFFASPDQLLRQVVQTLGRLPDRWWRAWPARTLFFDDASGKPHQSWAHVPAGRPLAVEFPLHDCIADIGTESAAPAPSVVEAAQLEDLLAQLLRYEPDERSSATEIRRHTWFAEPHEKPDKLEIDRLQDA